MPPDVGASANHLTLMTANSGQNLETVIENIFRFCNAKSQFVVENEKMHCHCTPMQST